MRHFKHMITLSEEGNIMKYYLFMDFADGTTKSVHAPFNSPEDAWAEKDHIVEYLKTINKELPVSWCVVESSF